MAYSGLTGFIDELAKRDELRRIKNYINPELEITEITDRVTKSGGKALLFENTGTDFPLLINAYGSDKRMAMAIGRENLDDTGKEIDELFDNLSASRRQHYSGNFQYCHHSYVWQVSCHQEAVEEASASRLSIKIRTSVFFLFLNAGHTMVAVL